MVIEWTFMLFNLTVLSGNAYQKFAELRQEFVAPFNSNFHNKTLCESGFM
jgi:hypothetical protein